MGLTHAPWWWEIDDDEITLPEMLAEAGYETHLCGFQHVASPGRLGFQHSHSRDADAEETTAAAAEVFADAGEKPLYVQVGFTEVHRKFNQGTYTEKGVYVPPYLEETEAIRDDFARFQASINYFDDRVGEVLNAIDVEGLREDTVVVLAADHGIPHPGAKWTCRKPGIEIAMLMSGPRSAFESNRVSAISSGVDLVPTLLDAIDIPVPKRVEGVSFEPYLIGDTDEPPRDAAFAQFTEHMKRDNESRSIITKDRHLIRYFDQGRTVDYPVSVDPDAFADHIARMDTTGSARPFAQLYDTGADPYELDDLGCDPEYQCTVTDLSRRLLQWMVSVDDPLLRGRTPLPYYDMAVEDLFIRSLDSES
jgi:arylsulfatase A-like enzyme